MIPFTVSGDRLTVVTREGKTHTVRRDDYRYDDILEAIRDNDVNLVEDLASRTVIASFLACDDSGQVTYCDGVVQFNGEPVHHVVVDRIVEHAENNLPFENLLNFLGLLLENPSANAVNETFDFLEHKCLTIDEDGFIVAFKGVRQDYFDIYTGRTHLNRPGDVVSEPRNKVEDNREVGCAQGLHAGSESYARGYMGSGRLMLVRIDPR